MNKLIKEKYEEATEEKAEMDTEITGNDAEDVFDASSGEMSSAVCLDVRSDYGDEVNVTDMKAEPVSGYIGDIVLEQELYAENKYRLLLMVNDEMKGYIFNVE